MGTATRWALKVAVEPVDSAQRRVCVRPVWVPSDFWKVTWSTSLRLNALSAP